MKPKKLLSIILAMVITISLMPTFALTASAETYPTVKKQRDWYNGTTYKEYIYTIEIVDEYTVTGDETEAWDASENGDE